MSTLMAFLTHVQWVIINLQVQNLKKYICVISRYHRVNLAYLGFKIITASLCLCLICCQWTIWKWRLWSVSFDVQKHHWIVGNTHVLCVCVFFRYQSIESGKHAECASDWQGVQLIPNKMTSTSQGWFACRVNFLWLVITKGVHCCVSSCYELPVWSPLNESG